MICFNNIADALAKSYNDKIKKVSKTYNKIIQRQLKMRMVKKYIKKYNYLQEKDKKYIDEMRSINLLDNTPNQPTN